VPELPDETRPTVVLCDYAENVNGKLYIQGAGWSRLAADVPFPMAIAVFWRIPWGQSNQPHRIVLALMTEDGTPFLDPEGKPVRAEGSMEVGRPPGLKAGTSLDAPLAVRLPPLAFPAGGYRVEFHVNDSLEATASFQAHGGGTQ